MARELSLRSRQFKVVGMMTFLWTAALGTALVAVQSGNPVWYIATAVFFAGSFLGVPMLRYFMALEDAPETVNSTAIGRMTLRQKRKLLASLIVVCWGLAAVEIFVAWYYGEGRWLVYAAAQLLTGAALWLTLRQLRDSGVGE